MIGSEVTGLLAGLMRAIWRAALPMPRQPIVEWCQETVQMGADITGAHQGPLRPHPYQIAPLRASEDTNVRQITVMAGQRLGKSILWKLDMLKRINDGNLIGMVLYPSLKDAEETNRDTVLPLLKTLRAVKRDLALRGNIKKDSYHLPSSSSIMYFSGTKPAINKTLNWGVIDEADFHVMENADAEGKNTSNVLALRIRMKTHPVRLLWVVSSPLAYGGVTYQEWKQGSRGVWNLRCLACNGLCKGNQLAFPMPDGSHRGLQWQKDEGGNVISASIRYLCPTCGAEHVEAQAKEMNAQGEFVHENPAQEHHLSFQIGALANPELTPWLEVAEAQERAVNPDGKKFLRNSILGMPYKHTREGVTGESIPEVLDSRRTPYPVDLGARISAVFLGVDTQAHGLAGSKYWVWTARGWCENGDSFMLDCGIANSLTELALAGSQEWHGHKPLLCVVDHGGFDNTQDLEPFVQGRPGWLMYKGEDAKGLKGEKLKLSEVSHRLILANALGYQIDLLDAIYGPARPQGYRWQIPEEAPKDYLDQIGSVRPNERKENGDAFGNWKAAQRRDYFDAEKLCLVALDAACRLVSAPLWPRRNLPLFKRLEILAALKRQAASGSGRKPAKV